MRPELVSLDPSRRRSILAAVMLGTILGPIDASIVNVVLPTIARSFSASLAAAQWVPMIYLVTAGRSPPPTGEGSSASSPALAVGPSLGGFLAAAFGWRAAFS